MSTACNARLTVAQLTEYWLGELDSSALTAMEDHLFACEACSRELQQLVQLGDGLRLLVRQGAVATILTPAFIERLKHSGVRIREYHLAPQGSVYCTIAPQDDLVVAHLAAPLQEAAQVDLVFEDIEAGRRWRLVDVPFDAASGEVVIAPNAAELRLLDTATQRVQLLRVDPADERVLAEYTFNHSRYG